MAALEDQTHLPVTPAVVSTPGVGQMCHLLPRPVPTPTPPPPPLWDRVYGEEDGWKRQKDAIWQMKLKAEGKLEIVWVSFAGSIPELRQGSIFKPLHRC